MTYPVPATPGISESMFDRQRLVCELIALGCLSTMWRHEGWPGTR